MVLSKVEIGEAVDIPCYNLFAGLGIGAGIALYRFGLERSPSLSQRLMPSTNLLLVALPGAFVGAVLFDRAVGVSASLAFPISGLAFYGGLLGGSACFAIGTTVLRLPTWELLDLAAPAVALGHAIGRIGCFLGGCCYGVRLTEANSLYYLGFRHAPTQLVESLFCGILGAGLLVMPTKPTGRRAVVYLLAYGTGRFMLEFWRADYRGRLPSALGGSFLSPSQFVALSTAIASAVIWLAWAILGATAPSPDHNGGTKEYGRAAKEVQERQSKEMP